MHQNPVKINSIGNITHDVLQVITEKPANYSFRPGQATDVTVNKDGWKNKRRPFTFTSLPEKEYLEFTIKTYPAHQGVTNQIRNLKRNDEFLLHEVFGDIAYNGEGVFIAGGAGVTPFISIFRYLQSIHEMGSNKLIFSNKAKKDIILEQELGSMLGNNFINILSEEKTEEYAYGHITEDFLKDRIDIDKHIYLCGPPPMMEAVEKQLTNLKVDKSLIIKESF